MATLDEVMKAMGVVNGKARCHAVDERTNKQCQLDHGHRDPFHYASDEGGAWIFGIDPKYK